MKTAIVWKDAMEFDGTAVILNGKEIGVGIANFKTNKKESL